ncbi:MAG TPA: zinc ribbon domain-containing protein [Tepidisphaeraceae bacterium]|jgi:hypothetical protein|nr:zinc ribbon domain-containing protein [Tepidisphaeraceae bacterium]
MTAKSIKTQIAAVLREYARHDLRTSHIVVGAMIVVGALLNLIFTHGWTVWPFVLAFGILTYINEAADRNGQGIPPLQVYAFFVGVGAFWVVIVLVISRINPIIMLIGIAALLYRVTEALLRQRERDRLIAFRRTQGLCIHCGEMNEPDAVLCESCGEEPNPEDAILKRVAQICRTPQDMVRARATLMRTAVSTSAGAKESALLARHRTGKVAAKKTELPKAAKLGNASGSSKRNRG